MIDNFENVSQQMHPSFRGECELKLVDDATGEVIREEKKENIWFDRGLKNILNGYTGIYMVLQNSTAPMTYATESINPGYVDQATVGRTYESAYSRHRINATFGSADRTFNRIGISASSGGSNPYCNTTLDDEFVQVTGQTVYIYYYVYVDVGFMYGLTGECIANWKERAPFQSTTTTLGSYNVGVTMFNSEWQTINKVHSNNYYSRHYYGDESYQWSWYWGNTSTFNTGTNPSLTPEKYRRMMWGKQFGSDGDLGSTLTGMSGIKIMEFGGAARYKGKHASRVWVKNNSSTAGYFDSAVEAIPSGWWKAVSFKHGTADPLHKEVWKGIQKISVYPMVSGDIAASEYTYDVYRNAGIMGANTAGGSSKLYSWRNLEIMAKFGTHIAVKANHMTSYYDSWSDSSKTMMLDMNSTSYIAFGPALSGGLVAHDDVTPDYISQLCNCWPSWTDISYKIMFFQFADPSNPMESTITQTDVDSLGQSYVDHLQVIDYNGSPKMLTMYRGDYLDHKFDLLDIDTMTWEDAWFSDTGKTVGLNIAADDIKWGGYNKTKNHFIMKGAVSDVLVSADGTTDVNPVTVDGSGYVDVFSNYTCWSIQRNYNASQPLKRVGGKLLINSSGYKDLRANLNGFIMKPGTFDVEIELEDIKPFLKDQKVGLAVIDKSNVHSAIGYYGTDTYYAVKGLPGRYTSFTTDTTETLTEEIFETFNYNMTDKYDSSGVTQTPVSNDQIVYPTDPRNVTFTYDYGEFNGATMALSHDTTHGSVTWRYNTSQRMEGTGASIYSNVGQYVSESNCRIIISLPPNEDYTKIRRFSFYYMSYKGTTTSTYPLYMNGYFRQAGKNSRVFANYNNYSTSNDTTWRLYSGDMMPWEDTIEITVRLGGSNTTTTRIGFDNFKLVTLNDTSAKDMTSHNFMVYGNDVDSGMNEVTTDRIATLGAVTNNTLGTLNDGVYNNGGSGYPTTTNGSGTGATVEVTVSGTGTVVTLALVNPGINYIASDTIVVAESTDFSDLDTGTIDSTVATVEPNSVDVTSLMDTSAPKGRLRVVRDVDDLITTWYSLYDGASWSAWTEYVYGDTYTLADEAAVCIFTDDHMKNVNTFTSTLSYFKINDGEIDKRMVALPLRKVGDDDTIANFRMGRLGDPRSSSKGGQACWTDKGTIYSMWRGVCTTYDADTLEYLGDKFWSDRYMSGTNFNWQTPNEGYIIFDELDDCGDALGGIVCYQNNWPAYYSNNVSNQYRSENNTGTTGTMQAFSRYFTIDPVNGDIVDTTYLIPTYFDSSQPSEGYHHCTATTPYMRNWLKVPQYYANDNETLVRIHYRTHFKFGWDTGLSKWKLIPNYDSGNGDYDQRTARQKMVTDGVGVGKPSHADFQELHPFTGDVQLRIIENPDYPSATLSTDDYYTHYIGHDSIIVDNQQWCTGFSHVFYWTRAEKIEQTWLPAEIDPTGFFHLSDATLDLKFYAIDTDNTILYKFYYLDPADDKPMFFSTVFTFDIANTVTSQNVAETELLIDNDLMAQTHNYYKDKYLISGGESRLILDYDDYYKIFTIDSAFTTTPTTGDGVTIGSPAQASKVGSFTGDNQFIASDLEGKITPSVVGRDYKISFTHIGIYRTW